MKELYLAGGCFWGVEAYFKMLDGVINTSVGYANGNTENPSYEDVCRRNTGHAETVMVRYDDNILSTTDLLTAYFRIIDPTVKDRQGPDIGTQYRTGIYYTDITDLDIIQFYIKEVQLKYSSPIVTEVKPLTQYFDAEAYHQDYLDKNPNGYCHIPLNSLRKELGK